MNRFTKSKLYYKGIQTKYGKLFLTILSIFTIVFIGCLICSHHVFLKSQDNIKNCYVEHLKRVDSLYLNILRYNKDVVVGIQKISDATLADSLIKATLTNTRHLSKEQSNNLEVIIKSHFKEIESLHEKYGEKLLRDSLRMGVERDLLNGQTKTMIDLHLNKIEHEYSNITLWAAVLTILFLVFSFYSVYKADELIKQGTDSLKEIRRIKTQGEQAVETLMTEGREILTNTKTFIKEQQNIMSESNKEFDAQKSEIERAYRDSLRELNVIKEYFNTQVDKLHQEFEQEFEKDMETLRLEQEQKLSRQQDEFRNLVVEVNNFFTYLKEQKLADGQESKDTKAEDIQ